MVYDFSHYELRGFKLDATLELLAPLTAFVHVKDGKGRRQVQVLLPGEGRVDYPRYLRQLKDAAIAARWWSR